MLLGRAMTTAFSVSGGIAMRVATLDMVGLLELASCDVVVEREVPGRRLKARHVRGVVFDTPEGLKDDRLFVWAVYDEGEDMTFVGTGVPYGQGEATDTVGAASGVADDGGDGPDEGGADAHYGSEP